MEYITVEEAVKKAFWQIKVPFEIVVVVPILTYALLAKACILPAYGSEGLMWAGPILILSLIGGWLVRSIQIPRWRLWAYQRVKNINELKEFAIYKKVIWPKGHFYQKSEIASKKVWQEIKRIENENNKNT